MVTVGDLLKKAVTFDSREKWLRGRKQFLGGSDIPTVLGIPWSEGAQPASRFALWAEKTGRLDKHEDPKMEVRFSLGHELEPWLSRRLDDHVGPKGMVCLGPGGVWPHHAIVVAGRVAGRCLGVTLDGVVIETASDGRRAVDARVAGVAEFKTISPFERGKWEDGPSPYVIVQAHAQMVATGLDRAWVVALFGLEEVVVYELERNEELADGICTAAEEFWSYVVDDSPPAADASDACRRTLRAIHGRENPGTIVELRGEQWVDFAARFEVVAAAAAEAKRQRDLADDAVAQMENQVAQAIGANECATILGPDGLELERWTWKTGKDRAGYYVPPKEGSRTLRRQRRKS